MMRNLLEITLRIRIGLMYQLTIVLLHIQYKKNKNVKFLFFSGEQQKSVSIQTLTKISQGRHTFCWQVVQKVESLYIYK